MQIKKLTLLDITDEKNKRPDSYRTSTIAYKITDQKAKTYIPGQNKGI